MAEKELEQAQKALCAATDYDCDSDRGSSDEPSSSSTGNRREEKKMEHHDGDHPFLDVSLNNTNNNDNAAATATATPTTPSSLSFDPLANQRPVVAEPTILNAKPSLEAAAFRTLSLRIPAPNSLFDDDDSTTASVMSGTSQNEGGVGVELAEFLDGSATTTTTTRATSVVPGAAGYLEMEEEPPRRSSAGSMMVGVGGGTTTASATSASEQYYRPSSARPSQQIRTDSGLYLTHRKAPATHTQQQQPPPRRFNLHQQRQPSESFIGGIFRHLQHDYFAGGMGGLSGGLGAVRPGGRGRHSMAMVQARRFMSLVRIWIVLAALAVLAMTGVFFHSLGHKEIQGDMETQPVENQEGQVSMNDVFANANSIEVTPPQEILLLPLDGISKLSSSSSQHGDLQQQYQLQPSTMGGGGRHHLSHDQHQHHRMLMDLRQDFEAWILHHNKSYHSAEEKERRFSIWTNNHHRTNEKNRRHGPCRLTKQHVFGSNRFQDLEPEEFKSQHLSGYTGMRADELDHFLESLPPGLRKLRKDNGKVLDPKIHRVSMHETVRQRHLKYHPQAGPLVAASTISTGYGSSSPNCAWYDISCFLQYLWRTYGVTLRGYVGTMEPAFDSDSYPNSIDWRDSGAVTDVRTQGSCGACWAITAVETIESAHYIATGTLYDLAETEVIACDDSCEMCNGGWPQNAFSWAMKYGGLPLASTLSYDADTMLTLTYALEDEDQSTIEAYRAGICPADANSNSKSNDEASSYWDESVENKNYGDYTNQGRFGNIKGYGYATDRCLCYSDGSGCDCEDQDEDLAIRNLATYGPAAVCLEASLWQDYSGGIITAEIGCGQEFLDMNHCVQVVGYAFTTNSNDEEGENENQRSGSGSGSNDRSGSSSSDSREGYWIVRNQWGSWGMNGYAYVAMGENTCGILNDMTQAYL